MFLPIDYSDTHDSLSLSTSPAIAALPYSVTRFLLISRRMLIISLRREVCFFQLGRERRKRRRLPDDLFGGPVEFITAGRIYQPQRDQAHLASDHDPDYGPASELPRLVQVSRELQRPQYGGQAEMFHQGMRVMHTRVVSAAHHRRLH